MQVRRPRPLHKQLQQPCSIRKSQQHLLSSNAKPAFRTIQSNERSPSPTVTMTSSSKSLLTNCLFTMSQAKQQKMQTLSPRDMKMNDKASCITI